MSFNQETISIIDRTTTMVSFATAVTSLLLMLPFTGHAWESTCTQFKDIYTDGTDLCEKMWDNSFEVVDDEDQGYTMWFFDEDNNPNEDITRTLFGDDAASIEECHLKYFHKDVPGPEDDMTECHPWKKRACCNTSTVKSVDTLNEAYGEGYQWNRCGPMTQACERFFVMEACFYECEPSAGLFRKYNDSQAEHPDFNEWQLHKMPIKKSFCNAWYTACYNDYFCGKGNFFECQAFYEASRDGGGGKDNQGLIIGLSIAGFCAFVGLLFTAHLVHREKRGSPVFAPPESGVQS